MKRKFGEDRWCWSGLMMGWTWGLVLTGWAVSTAADLPHGAVARLGTAADSNPNHAVYGLVFSPDGTRVATRSTDRIVRLWEAEGGAPLREWEAYENGRVADLVFSHDGKRLLTMSTDTAEPLIAWDVTTGKVLERIEETGKLLHTSREPGRFLAVGSARVLEFSLGAATRAIPRYLVHRRARAEPIAISHDEKRVLLYVHPPANSPGRHILLLHRIATSEESALPPFELPVLRAAFSPSDQRLAVVCRDDPHLHLRDVTLPQSRIALAGHTQAIQDVCYSSDGRHLATVGLDGQARVWETLTSTSALTIGGHGDRLVAVRFSPDGHRLATGSAGRDENCAVVWNLRELLFPPPVAGATGPVRGAEVLWDQLGAKDASQAYRAIADLLHSVPSTMQMLQRKIDQETDPVSSEEIAELIGDLNDPAYEVRQAATERLLRARVMAQSSLAAALQHAGSVEARLRLQRILRSNASRSLMTAEETRRIRRVIYVLELLSDKATAKLLAALATGHTQADIAREAAAAAARLARQIEP